MQIVKKREYKLSGEKEKEEKEEKEEEKVGSRIRRRFLVNYKLNFEHPEP